MRCRRRATGWCSATAPRPVSRSPSTPCRSAAISSRRWRSIRRGAGARPGDPAAETWKGDSWKGDSWKTGGGSVWIQGSYDPAANLAYFGTGNGGPWTPDARPGDNLYTSSIVALDLDSGKIKGHHQYHWNDAWDWDEVSAPVLIDIERDGKTIPAAIHAGRNGYLWTLERSKDGPLSFVEAKPFVYQNVFSSLDPKTGRPTYDQSKIPGINRRAAFCPGLWGGKDWPPEAYNPKTGLFYIPSNDNLCSELAGAQAGTRKPGELYIGIPIDEVLNSLRLRDGVDPSKPFAIGAIQAWDPRPARRPGSTTSRIRPIGGRCSPPAAG